MCRSVRCILLQRKDRRTNNKRIRSSRVGTMEAERWNNGYEGTKYKRVRDNFGVCVYSIAVGMIDQLRNAMLGSMESRSAIR